MARRAEAAGDGERETVLGREGQRALEAVEHRRDVEGTVLHQAVRGHLASFLAETAERGGLPRFVERDFARYLACGVPAYGFARLACDREVETLAVTVASGPATWPPPGLRRKHPVCSSLDLQRTAGADLSRFCGETPSIAVSVRRRRRLCLA